ncbi:hypothetical protein QFZ25_003229 [Bacillus atrophaeus]|nr:hypothetical protein [Bacillus atrophaeus]
MEIPAFCYTSSVLRRFISFLILCAALMISPYPVQRPMFPDSLSAISSSAGLGISRNSALRAIVIPGEELHEEKSSINEYPVTVFVNHLN